VSLFLDWSTRSARALRDFLIMFGSLDRLGPVLSSFDRTGWQVYPVAGSLLAALAALLVAVAFVGGRPIRPLVTILSLAALVFAIHALAAPPASAGSRSLIAPLTPHDGVTALGAEAGPGETLAIVALIVALVGLALGLASRPLTQP
jgi:hypothetical protein